MFHARKPSPDHVAATLAFALLLASWCAVCATLMPPAARPVRAHLAPQVQR